MCQERRPQCTHIAEKPASSSQNGLFGMHRTDPIPRRGTELSKSIPGHVPNRKQVAELSLLLYATTDSTCLPNFLNIGDESLDALQNENSLDEVNVIVLDIAVSNK